VCVCVCVCVCLRGVILFSARFNVGMGWYGVGWEMPPGGDMVAAQSTPHALSHSAVKNYSPSIPGLTTCRNGSERIFSAGTKRKPDEAISTDVSTPGVTVTVESEPSHMDNGVPDQATSAGGTSGRKALKLSLPTPKQEENGTTAEPFKVKQEMPSPQDATVKDEGTLPNSCGSGPMDTDNGPGPPSVKTEHMERATEKLYISSTDESSMVWRAGVAVDVQVEGSEVDGIASEGISVKLEQKVEAVQSGTAPEGGVPDAARIWEELERLGAPVAEAVSAVEVCGVS
jgi:hypothetical protein